jgi:hypothetical protein
MPEAGEKLEYLEQVEAKELPEVPVDRPAEREREKIAA